MRNDRPLMVAAVVVVMALAGCKTGTDDRKDPHESIAAGGVGGEPSVDGGDHGQPAGQEKRIYWNQVAGRFYPAKADELNRMLGEYIGNAGAPPASVAEADLLGFISPHAGYPFSGPVAGWGYRLLEERTVSTVIVLGFSHKGRNAKSSVLDFDGYRTPLGSIPIDTEMVEALLAKGPDVLDTSQAPFAGEHSLETQLPFIAKAAPDAKIVPIMVGRPGGQLDQGLVDLLHEIIGTRGDIVVVASTDLSHYKPYDEGSTLDAETLDLIAAGDWASLQAGGVQSGRMCGYYTVGVLMGLVAKHGQKGTGTRIKYLNSGDTAGDKDAGVVGYGVVAFTLPAGTRVSSAGGSTSAPTDTSSPSSLDGSLPDPERSLLLTFAREAAIAAVNAESYSAPEPQSSQLHKSAGVFVILKVRDRIRGMAGNVEADGPLYEAVVGAAMEAVASDPRYPSPGKSDIPDLECVVIVVHETLEFESAAFLAHEGPARGLFVEGGGQSAFVGPGEGDGKIWTPVERIAQGCRRIGLSPTCHKSTKKQTVVPVFTVLVAEQFENGSTGTGG